MTYAGQTVKIKFKGAEEILDFQVRDKWTTVSGGQRWTYSAIGGNWAAKNYAERVLNQGLPDDDDVWYGKIGGLGCLVHSTEILEDVLA